MGWIVLVPISLRGGKVSREELRRMHDQLNPGEFGTRKARSAPSRDTESVGQGTDSGINAPFYCIRHNSYKGNYIFDLHHLVNKISNQLEKINE